MNIIPGIRKTFEESMGTSAGFVHRLDGVSNNEVYIIEAEKKSYIFKIYTQADWPEDGKLPFVAKKLDEYKITHAKLYDFSRKNEAFPNGYLIEELLPGVTANKLNLTFEENIKLYEKLAAVVSEVHKISLDNYGFIGANGIADWTSMSDYIYDFFDDSTSSLREKNLIAPERLNSIREKLYEEIKACDCYPSVLCHGDLSTSNILVNADDIVIIDWDDAQALCWMADIARMTYWMKLKYDESSYTAYRNAFLKHYKSEYDIRDFDKLENAFHIWFGLDYLNFAAERPNYNKNCEAIKTVLEKDLAKAGWFDDSKNTGGRI